MATNQASIPNLKVKGMTGAQVYENWKVFQFQFRNFLLAFNHSEAKEEKKVALLLHLLGPEVVNIFQSFSVDLTKVKCDDLIQKFEDFFSPKKKLSLERHKFFTRHQKPQESIESYVTDLKNLASTCEFKNLTESLIKDIFIVGLEEDNQHIKERLLQENEDKTLADIIDIARTIEMSRTNQNMKVQNDVMKVQTRDASKSKNVWKPGERTKKQCTRCGLQFHPVKVCPAAKAKCYKCAKIGHYGKMCFFKQRNVAMLAEEDKEDADYTQLLDQGSHYFIGSILEGECQNQNKWSVLAFINNEFEIPIRMFIDTGAEANVLSLQDFQSLNLPRSIIKPTMSKLTNYGGSNIPTLGQCILKCKINNMTLLTRFFICETNQPTILGLTSSIKFDIIRKVGVVKHEFGEYNDLMSQFNDIFSGLGCLPGECHITLREHAQPHINPPRRVPFKLMDRYKTELDRMCADKVIEKVVKPTKWVSSVVLVEKPDRSLRVCLDSRPLNKAIMVPKYELPTLDNIRSQLNGATYFSKLDASSAFWSICLDDESSDLCTFSTPFGRYKFLRLPYGISCASEKFQQKLVELLTGLEGILIYVDDLLCFGKDKAEHDQRLQKLLHRIRDINLKLNIKKCEIGVQKIKFLGQVFEASGMSTDLSKVHAIQNMPQPTCVKDLQRFLGMVNYLSSFIPNMSDRCSNLRKLLKKSNLWSWEAIHTKEFNDLKDLISNAPILAHYDVNKPVVLTVDSSKDAVGACILQDGKPIAYASKSLTESQKLWAVIEKETFAVWFGTFRFNQFVYGQEVTVETDHKPLVTIFKKQLANIPNRLQRIMLKLQKYNLNVVYKSGKEMYISDTLSRAALPEKCTEFDEMLDQELSIHANMLFRSLNASDEKMKEIGEKTKMDKILQMVIKYINSGWPRYCKAVPDEVKAYYKVKDCLHYLDGIIFKNNCIVIPKVMQQDMLKDIHTSHMGLNKTKNYVQDIIYWPRLYDDLKAYIEMCDVCQKYKPCNPKEPLIPHEMPQHPWEKVGCDLFEFNKCNYLILVDYYSRFFETVKLTNYISETIIAHMKSIFSRQGVPALIISDNGPPFNSNDIKSFYKEWNITCQYSSPYYPKSNGLVEGTVKLVKNTLIKCQEGGNDPYLALLHLRNACQFGQEAPSKLLNARYLRTNIPVVKDRLRTKPVPYKNYVQNAENRMKSAKDSYDKNSKELPPLLLNDSVWFQKKPRTVWLPAVVTKLPHDLNSFKAYQITTPNGKVFIRNRVYLRKRIVKENDRKQVENNSENHDCNNFSFIPNNSNNGLNYDFNESLYSSLYFTGTQTDDNVLTRSGDVLNTELDNTLTDLNGLSESLVVNTSHQSPEVVTVMSSDDYDDSFNSIETESSGQDDSILDPTWKP